MSNRPQGPLASPPDISDVQRDPKEKLFGALSGVLKGGTGQTGGNSLDDAIAAHHQKRLDEAKMYRQLAATLAGSIATGFDPKTGQPLSPEQEQEMENQYQTAWAAYEKAAGVSKDTKTAVGRAKNIIGHLINVGKARRGEAQPAQPGQGGMSGPQGGVPTGPLKSPPPPPGPSVDQQALAAPVLAQQSAEAERSGTASRERQNTVELNKKLAKEAGLQEGTRDYQEFVLTNKFPTGRGGGLQRAAVMDPNTGEVTAADFDPASGKYINPDTQQPIVGALPATASMLQPKPFKYLSPDGKQLPGFQMGAGKFAKYYDMDMQPLPSGTQIYTRGLQGTDTMRQVITYDAQGNPQINTLETTRTPFLPGSKSPAGAAPSGSTPPKTPSGGGGKKTALTPPPAPGAATGGQAVDARGKPLGFSAAAQKNQAQKATTVREGISQIYGDPTNPTLKPLKDFSSLADNKDSQDHIAKAWGIIVDQTGLSEGEKTGAGMTLIQASLQVPQMLAEARAKISQDVLNQMSQEEREAFDATITAFSSAVGFRSLTSASSAMFSVKAIERDIPIIGLTASTSQQFNDKLTRLGELANNGIKTISTQVITPEERSFYRHQMGIPPEIGDTRKYKGQEYEYTGGGWKDQKNWKVKKNASTATK